MSTEPSPTLLDAVAEALDVTAWRSHSKPAAILDLLGLDPLWTVEQLQTALDYAKLPIRWSEALGFDNRYRCDFSTGKACSSCGLWESQDMGYPCAGKTTLVRYWTARAAVLGETP